jgi:uncharacterized Zn finger protein
MPETPSIDYSCPQCGASQTYQLVPMDTGELDQHAMTTSRETPSIDLSCSRCGAIQTYQLVAVGEAA